MFYVISRGCVSCYLWVRSSLIGKDHSGERSMQGY